MIAGIRRALAALVLFALVSASDYTDRERLDVAYAELDGFLANQAPLPPPQRAAQSDQLQLARSDAHGANRRESVLDQTNAVGEPTIVRRVAFGIRHVLDPEQLAAHTNPDGTVSPLGCDAVRYANLVNNATANIDAVATDYELDSATDCTIPASVTRYLVQRQHDGSGILIVSREQTLDSFVFVPDSIGRLPLSMFLSTESTSLLVPGKPDVVLLQFADTTEAYCCGAIVSYYPITASGDRSDHSRAIRLLSLRDYIAIVRGACNADWTSLGHTVAMALFSGIEDIGEAVKLLPGEVVANADRFDMLEHVFVDAHTMEVRWLPVVSIREEQRDPDYWWRVLLFRLTTWLAVLGQGADCMQDVAARMATRTVALSSCSADWVSGTAGLLTNIKKRPLLMSAEVPLILPITQAYVFTKARWMHSEPLGALHYYATASRDGLEFLGEFGVTIDADEPVVMSCIYEAGDIAYGAALNAALNSVRASDAAPYLEPVVAFFDHVAPGSLCVAWRARGDSIVRVSGPTPERPYDHAIGPEDAPRFARELAAALYQLHVIASMAHGELNEWSFVRETGLSESLRLAPYLVGMDKRRLDAFEDGRVPADLPAWISPERILHVRALDEDAPHYTADIWSYGYLVLRIIGATVSIVPHDDPRAKYEYITDQAAVAVEFAAPLTPVQQDLAELAIECLQADPARRLTIAHLLQKVSFGSFFNVEDSWPRHQKYEPERPSPNWNAIEGKMMQAVRESEAAEMADQVAHVKIEESQDGGENVRPILMHKVDMAQIDDSYISGESRKEGSVKYQDMANSSAVVASAQHRDERATAGTAPLIYAAFDMISPHTPILSVTRGYTVQRLVASNNQRGRFVYAAVNRATGKQVVLKILTRNDGHRARSIIREHRIMRHIGAHHNILGVYGIREYCFAGQWSAALVLEAAEFDAQQFRASRNYPLMRSEISTILNGVLGALLHVHNSNYVHMDIKLENVLYVNNQHGSRWVLADFGLSEIAGHVRQHVHSTAWYEPPEMSLAGDSPLVISHVMDIWQVGLLALELYNNSPWPLKTVGFPRYFAAGYTDDKALGFVSQYLATHGVPQSYMALPDEAAVFITACLVHDMNKRPPVIALVLFPLVQTHVGASSSVYRWHMLRDVLYTTNGEYMRDAATRTLVGLFDYDAEGEDNDERTRDAEELVDNAMAYYGPECGFAPLLRIHQRNNGAAIRVTLVQSLTGMKFKHIVGNPMLSANDIIFIAQLAIGALRKMHFAGIVHGAISDTSVLVNMDAQKPNVLFELPRRFPGLIYDTDIDDLRKVLMLLHPRAVQLGVGETFTAIVYQS